MPTATPSSRVSAIVLAAGTSKRMGVPKQLLRLDDRTLLEHVLSNTRASQTSEIVLVLGHAAEDIRQQTNLENIKVVINPGYEQGMGTSLRAGLAALAPQAQAALIILADQPFVRPATLDQLIEQHRQSGAQIVLPMYRGFRGNPILLDRSVFPELAGLAGDVGCRAIFGAHTENILKVAVDDPGILVDVDSEDDLKKLREVGVSERPVLEFADGPRASEIGERPELVIVGHDSFAHALAAMARLLHFAVTVVDPLLSPGEFPEADCILHALDFSKLAAASERHVVVASRGQFDEEAIEQALAVNAEYIALVANKKRGQEIKRSLQLKGVPGDKLAQVRGPAGLEIGAISPEEIALSIMAEIVATRSARRDQNL